MKQIIKLTIVTLLAIATVSANAFWGFGDSDPLAKLVVPGGFNMYLGKAYDRGLMEGTNQAVDFERLTNVQTADQYALELVATTKFTTLVEAYKAWGVEHPNEQLEAQRFQNDEAAMQAFIEEYSRTAPYNARYGQASIAEKNHFEQRFNRLNPYKFTYAQSLLCGGYRCGYIEDPYGGKFGHFHPMTYQNQTIEAAWCILRLASDTALGTLNTVASYTKDRSYGSTRFTHKATAETFTDVGCALYAFDVLMQGDKWNEQAKHLYSQLRPEHSSMWSKERCEAVYEAIPQALIAYDFILDVMVKNKLSFMQGAALLYPSFGRLQMWDNR